MAIQPLNDGEFDFYKEIIDFRPEEGSKFFETLIACAIQKFIAFHRNCL